MIAAKRREAKNAGAPNPLRVDPSRTGPLFRKMAASLKRRWARFRRAVRALLVGEDAFGLGRGQEGVPQSPGEVVTGNAGIAWPATRDGKLDLMAAVAKELLAANAFNPFQPRIPKGMVGGGQWARADTGVLAVIKAAVTRALAKVAGLRGQFGGSAGTKLTRALAEQGGFTYHPVTGTSPTDGFMVSPYKSRERVLELKDASAKALVKYINRNADLLSKEDHYLGGWVDGGKVYLDISVRRETAGQALALAREHGQLAIFDLTKKETIHVATTANADQAQGGVAGSLQRVGAGHAEAAEPRRGGRPEPGRVAGSVAGIPRQGGRLAANVGDWQFRTSPEQLASFQEWLRAQLREDGLDPEGYADDDLWRDYLAEGFRKGAGRAFDDTRAGARAAALAEAGSDPARVLAWFAGTREEFLRSAFGAPVGKERLEVLVSRVFTDLKGVNEAMAAKLQRVLADGLARGTGARELAREIDRAIEGIGLGRSLLIARSEIIRSHAEGQLLAFERLGVEELGVMVEWRVARDLKGDADERVCPQCAEMDEEVYSIQDARGLIPYHPGCLPGDSLVTSRCRVAAVSERWYDGNLVVIRTASGRELACTPNHPILGDGGWIPAHLLDEGSQVVCDGGREWESVFVNHQDENAPTRIEQVAAAFAESSQVSAKEVPLSSPDFHSDAMDGDVAIVWSHCQLRGADDFSLHEHAEKQPFAGGRESVRIGLPSECGVAQFPERPLSSSGSFVGSGGLPLTGSTPHLLPLDGFRFALRSSANAGLTEDCGNWGAGNSMSVGDAVLRLPREVSGNDQAGGQIGRAPDGAVGVPQDADDDLRRDAELARKLSCGDACPVFLDQVVSVRIKRHSGHVYNLQTEGGWYAAQGIITHNCRCVWLPRLPDALGGGIGPEIQPEEEEGSIGDVDLSVGVANMKNSEEAVALLESLGSDMEIADNWNPLQPRIPKGIAGGGRWFSSGGLKDFLKGLLPKLGGGAAGRAALGPDARPAVAAAPVEIHETVDLKADQALKDGLKEDVKPVFTNQENAAEIGLVQRYTEDSYLYLNQEMRACPPHFECLEGSSRKMMSAIERLIAKAGPLKRPVDLYRGMRISTGTVEEMLKQAEALVRSGGEFRMPSLTSTSLDPVALKIFGAPREGAGVVFKIKAKTGLYVDPVSLTAGEQEVIQSAFTRYKVVGTGKLTLNPPAPGRAATTFPHVIYLEEI